MIVANKVVVVVVVIIEVAVIVTVVKNVIAVFFVVVIVGIVEVFLDTFSNVLVEAEVCVVVREPFKNVLADFFR